MWKHFCLPRLCPIKICYFPSDKELTVDQPYGLFSLQLEQFVSNIIALRQVQQFQLVDVNYVDSFGNVRKQSSEIVEEK